MRSHKLFMKSIRSKDSTSSLNKKTISLLKTLTFNKMNQKWKTLMKAISILIFRIKKIYYNTIKLPKISNYLPQG